MQNKSTQRENEEIPESHEEKLEDEELPRQGENQIEQSQHQHERQEEHEEVEEVGQVDAVEEQQEVEENQEEVNENNEEQVQEQDRNVEENYEQQHHEVDEEEQNNEYPNQPNEEAEQQLDNMQEQVNPGVYETLYDSPTPSDHYSPVQHQEHDVQLVQQQQNIQLQEQQELEDQQPPNQQQSHFQAEIIEEQKINQERQEQIEHVYDQQEPIQEWRDEEMVLNQQRIHLSDFTVKAQDYNFVGLNDNEEELIDQAQQGQSLLVRQEELNQPIVQERQPEIVPQAQVKEVVRIPEPVEVKTVTENLQPKIQEKPKASKPKVAKSAPQITKPMGSQIIKVQAVKIEENQKRSQVEHNPTQVPKEETVKNAPHHSQPKVEKRSNLNPKTETIVSQAKVNSTTQAIKEKPAQTIIPKTNEVKQIQTKKTDIKTVQSNAPKNKEIAKTQEPKQNKTQQVPSVKLEASKTELNLPIVESIPPARIIEQSQQAPKRNEQSFKQREEKDKIIIPAAVVPTRQIYEEQRQQPIQNKFPPAQSNVLLLRNMKKQAQNEEAQKSEIQREEPQAKKQQQQPQSTRQQLYVRSQQPELKKDEASSQLKIAKKKKKKKVNSSQIKPQGESNNNGNNNNQQKLRELRASQPRRNSNIDPQNNDNPHDNASMIHQQRDPSQPSHQQERNLSNIINAQLIASVIQQPTLPPLTSLVVVKQAEKQRVGTTYKMFLKYHFQYERTVSNYKRIVMDICFELERKKQNKRPLQRTLEEYFEDFSKLCRDYNQRCYKIQVEDQVVSTTTNKFANIRLELKKGFDQMIYLRKSIANNSHRLNGYINSTVLPNLKKAFDTYYSLISQEENKQIQRRQAYFRNEKTFNKVISILDKNFTKSLEGKFKDDLFVDITHFINEQKVHRVALRNYGRGLIDLRHTYIKCEKDLFDHIQDIVNKFKIQSKAIYCFGPREFHQMLDYSHNIKSITKFNQLCTLTDLDYIKYVLQIQSKKETNEFTNRNFQSYLDLVFFDRVVGNIRNMLKGATNKVFPTEKAGEELIHSISGNLVLFNRENDHCKDKYAIRNLNAKIIGSGFVQFDELLKGIIFNESRTIRLKLKDEDRAEQLICYLNQKQEDIELHHSISA